MIFNSGTTYTLISVFILLSMLCNVILTYAFSIERHEVLKHIKYLSKFRAYQYSMLTVFLFLIGTILGFELKLKPLIGFIMTIITMVICRRTGDTFSMFFKNYSDKTEAILFLIFPVICGLLI